MTGTFIVNIPYRSNPPAVTDLIGGQIDVMITDMATGLPQVKGGKLKALGVSTTQAGLAGAGDPDHQRSRRARATR